MKIKDIRPLFWNGERLNLFESNKVVFSKSFGDLNKKYLDREIERIYTIGEMYGICIELKIEAKG